MKADVLEPWMGLINGNLSLELTSSGTVLNIFILIFRPADAGHGNERKTLIRMNALF